MYLVEMKIGYILILYFIPSLWLYLVINWAGKAKVRLSFYKYINSALLKCHVSVCVLYLAFNYDYMAIYWYLNIPHDIIFHYLKITCEGAGRISWFL